MLIKKIPDVSGLVTATVLDTKIKEIDNKIHDLSSLFNKTNYDTKISEIEEKYFTTFDYNKFTSNILDAKVKQKELVNRSNISNLVKKFELNAKLTTLATKLGKLKRLIQVNFVAKYFLVMMVFKICLFISQYLIC